MPAAGRQACLYRRRPDTTERVHDRKPDMPGEIGGLIEAALPPPRRVQRHWHDDLGASEDHGAANLHQLAQPSCQRPAAVVLERVNDRPQRAVVRPDGSRQDDQALLPPAAGAVFVVRPVRSAQVVRRGPPGR